MTTPTTSTGYQAIIIADNDIVHSRVYHTRAERHFEAATAAMAWLGTPLPFHNDMAGDVDANDVSFDNALGPVTAALEAQDAQLFITTVDIHEQGHPAPSRAVYNQKPEPQEALPAFRLQHYPQIPCTPFEAYSDDLATLLGLTKQLAAYDLFLNKHGHRNDYANATTIQALIPEGDREHDDDLYWDLDHTEIAELLGD